MSCIEILRIFGGGGQQWSIAYPVLSVLETSFLPFKHCLLVEREHFLKVAGLSCEY